MLGHEVGKQSEKVTDYLYLTIAASASADAISIRPSAAAMRRECGRR